MAKAQKAAAITFAVIVTTVYTATLFANISFAAGGADTSGYLGLARILSEGRTRVVIDPLRTLGLDDSFIRVFTPLGFTWGIPGTGTMAPAYPPGMAFHIVAAALIGGWDVGPFLVSPLAALGCAALMFCVGREFGLPPSLAGASAAILAVLPQFISHAIQPVSDVLATFWALVAIWFALLAVRRPAMAVAAGAAFAIGVWVRPTNVLMAIPLMIAFRARPALVVRFAAGGMPFAVALMLYHERVYGNPWRTGYGNALDLVSAGYVEASSRVLSRWMMVLCSPLVFPAGLLVAFDRRLAGWLRLLLPVWFGVFFLLYCFWAPFDVFWVARFLLPATPPLIIGALLIVRDLLHMPVSRRWSRTSATVATTLVVVMLLIPLRQNAQIQVLQTDDTEAIYPLAVEFAERHLPPDAIVISGALSGAFFYYSGRFSARLDQLDNDRFQLLRAYAGTHSLKWYAVVVEGEEYWDTFHTRLQGDWTPISRFRHVTLWRLDS